LFSSGRGSTFGFRSGGDSVSDGEEIIVTLSRQVSWSHFIALLPLNQPFQGEFDAEMCRIEGRSVRTLRERIDSILLLRPLDHDYPRGSWINAPKRRLSKEGDQFSGAKLRPIVHLTGRDHSSRRQMEPMAYLRLLTQRLPQCPAVVRRPREQYGNNTGRKTAQMIPSDPKSALR
jgi:hypothetical protein